MDKRVWSIARTLILTSMLIWLALSYLEILHLNTTNDPIYSQSNMFVVLFKLFDNVLKGGIF